MSKESLRIGQVAKRTGLDVRLIRHYEKMGLIPAPRRSDAGYASAGYRLFTEDHVQRLEFVALGRLLDLSLREIGELLNCVDEGCCTSAQPHARNLLEGQLQEVDRRIAMLQELRRRLQRFYQRLQDEAECRTPANCRGSAIPIQCTFGETAMAGNKERSGIESTNLLTLQRLETLESRRG
jgi:DNA-binding transcriptional MerR regulator